MLTTELALHTHSYKRTLPPILSLHICTAWRPYRPNATFVHSNISGDLSRLQHNL